MKIGTGTISAVLVCSAMFGVIFSVFDEGKSMEKRNTTDLEIENRKHERKPSIHKA